MATFFDLTGKNALITGAADGIGAAVGRRFREAGAEVIFTDVRDASDLAEAIGARFLTLDVADEQAVSETLERAAETVGKLDIVVNNAGIGDVGDDLETLDAATQERITRINQWGVQFGLKHAPKHMNDGGAIINTASLAARVSLPGSGAYSATKAAVVSLTTMSALELGARGIRVNAILPGYVATALGSGDEGATLMEAFTALGRVATTDDLVGVYHFLASEEASFITGQAIVVDGGWSAGPTPQLLSQVIGTSGVT